MSKLEKKIKETYENPDELIAIIRKVDLEKTLNVMLDKIETSLNNDDYSKLPSIAGPILSGVNSKIGPIDNAVEKQKIEYLLADLFDEYIGQISHKTNGQELLVQIDSNLKDACEIAGYNYEALSAIFNIKKYILLLPKGKSSNIYYYDLKDIAPHDMDAILRDLYDRRWIYSVKEARRLFKPVKGSLKVVCNPEKKNELLVFIHTLYSKGLIQPKGKGSSGHFKPFCNYAVDNDGNFLFPKSVNKAHERLKRNDEKYAELERKAIKIIEANAPKLKGQ